MIETEHEAALVKENYKEVMEESGGVHRETGLREGCWCMRYNNEGKLFDHL